MRPRLLTGLAALAVTLASCSDEDRVASSARDRGPRVEPTFLASPPPALPPGAAQFVTSFPGGGSGAPTPEQAAAGSPRGLSVVHTERATVPADRAAVVVFGSLRPIAPGGGTVFSSQDRQAVLERLAALGVRAEDVNLEGNPQFGPFTTVSVRVALGDLREQGPRIQSAIESVLGRSNSAGVQFSISDCSRALEPLRRQAFASARERAAATATAAGVTLGRPIALSEGVAPNTFGPPSDPCSTDLSGPKFPGVALAGYDARPEVVAGVQVAVTFSVDGAEGPGLTVTGGGTATARADRALLVVGVVTPGGSTGPLPIEARDRAEVLRRLAGLGINAADVKVESQPFGGPSTVSVRMTPERIARDGNQVLSAIEAVLGRAERQGAIFTHSNCVRVLAEAQKQALVDVRARAEALAGSAGLRAGAVVGISTDAPFSPYGPPSVDPCEEDNLEAVLFGPAPVQLKPFDADPLFEVRASLRVTYALAP